MDDVVCVVVSRCLSVSVCVGSVVPLRVMSGLFRSESMVYARMVMSEDVAYDTIKQLGTFGKAHIVDVRRSHHSSVQCSRCRLAQLDRSLTVVLLLYSPCSSPFVTL
jgi:hypothetical protein